MELESLKSSEQLSIRSQKVPVQVEAEICNPNLSTSKAGEKISFESIILENIKKKSTEVRTIKSSKRKVCGGAEIVPSKEIIQRLKEKDEKKAVKNKKNVKLN